MGKNIVLLSDGTGQRGGVGHESNVWRLYQALDHDDSRQLCCYDDGVGSQDYALFKAVGGAFGFGLKRNVCNLYAFLARHYETGDRIFLFGFSRGAFTVRLLAGMVASCGLLDTARCSSESDLWCKVQAAYCAYRRSYFAAGFADKFRRDYARSDHDQLSIRFVGVWDTVDAMGVPFDELRDAIDAVLRYSFRDHVLSARVEHGCHALALDEARKAFDPVMWDERLEVRRRIEQTWFAGVHSNVGGGYPKNQMALATLSWMIERASAYGLQVRTEAAHDIAAAADVHGRLYDSRRGLAAYYRYRPRDLESIRRDYTHGPLSLHASAMARVCRATDRYAPHNLCEMTLVHPGHGRLSVNDAWRRAMDHARSVCWLRAVMYFLLLLVTALMLIAPWFGEERLSASGFCGAVVEWPLKLIELLTPDLAAHWINGLRAHPCLTIGILVFLGFLVWGQKRLKTWHLNLSAAGWAALQSAHRPDVGDTLARADGSRLLKLAEVLRRSRALQFGRRFASGAFVRLMIWILMVPLRVGRAFNQWRCLRRTSLAGFDGTLRLHAGQRYELTFLTKDPQRSTGIWLQAGQAYDIRVERYAGWYADDLPATPDGLIGAADQQRAQRWLGVFLRRRDAPYFKLIAQIGGAARHQYVQVGQGCRVTPAVSGPLFLFVNDAVLPAVGSLGFLRDILYHNNRGIARISVQHVAGPAVAARP